MEYDIKFDKENPNTIQIFENGKMINMIACPPIENGCDVINFSDKLVGGYNYNFDGLIVITTKIERKVYHKGILLDKIKR